MVEEISKIANPDVLQVRPAAEAAVARD